MKLTIVNIFLLYLLTGSFSSCHKKEEKEIENDYLTSYVGSLHINNDIQWIVVLPGLGCHGCIQEGEAFMKDKVKNRNILFVLTRIESLKILQNKIGIDIKKQPNVYADTENKFNIPTDNSIYPCIVELKGGQIINHEFQSPNNSEAFFKLKSRVAGKSQLLS